MKNFLKATGLITLFMAIYMVMQIAYFIVSTVVNLFILSMKNPEIFQSNNLESVLMDRMANQIIISLLFSAVISFGIYYLICRARKENLFEVCQFKKMSPNYLLLLFPAGLTIYFANVLMLTLLNRISFMEGAFVEHGQLMSNLMGGPLLLTFIGVGIVVPFIEEVIFRGLIFNELRKHLSMKWTIIIQAVLFGLFHMQLIQGIYATLIGILLGLIYLWAKSIWAPILIHIIINSSSIILSVLPVEAFLESYGIYVFAISIVGVILSIKVLYKNKVVEVEPIKENENVFEEI